VRLGRNSVCEVRVANHVAPSSGLFGLAPDGDRIRSKCVGKESVIQILYPRITARLFARKEKTLPWKNIHPYSPRRGAGDWDGNYLNVTESYECLPVMLNSAGSKIGERITESLETRLFDPMGNWGGAFGLKVLFLVILDSAPSGFPNKVSSPANEYCGNRSYDQALTHTHSVTGTAANLHAFGTAAQRRNPPRGANQRTRKTIAQ
jgi:hypothetical protein